MPKRKVIKKKESPKIETDDLTEEFKSANQNLNLKKENSDKSDLKKGTKRKKTNKSSSNRKKEVKTVPSKEEKEEKIKAIIPSNDIIEIFDHENDKEWGFGWEFAKETDISMQWNKVEKAYSEYKGKEVKFSITWFSQDTEGFIPGEATKQYLIIWCWGLLLDKVKEVFSKKFPKITNIKRVYTPSSDLSRKYWEDMPKKDEIHIEGQEIILLPKNSPRRISPIPDDIIKTVPTKIPRFWTTKKMGKSRDWLVPIITKKDFDEKIVEPQDYIEEYIVEQSDFEILKDPKSKKMICLILPEEFNPKNELEKYSLPERFHVIPTGLDFGNMGGDLGGLDGLEDLNLGDSKNDNLDE